MHMTKITTECKGFFKLIVLICFAVVIIFCGLFLTGCKDSKKNDSSQIEQQQEQEQGLETLPYDQVPTPSDGWY